jgi:hypothetical protein
MTIRDVLAGQSTELGLVVSMPCRLVTLVVRT